MVRIIERRGEVCIILTLYALTAKLSMIFPDINLSFCSIKSKKLDILIWWILSFHNYKNASALCPFVGMGLFYLLNF